MKEVEKLIASAAARKAARQALAGRIEQHKELQAEVETARKILTRAVQVLSEAREAFPWAHSGLHPNGESDATLLAAVKPAARRALRRRG